MGSRLSTEDREWVLRNGDPELIRKLVQYDKLRRQEVMQLVTACFCFLFSFIALFVAIYF
jgi:hypothetical protein